MPPTCAPTRRGTEPGDPATRGSHGVWPHPACLPTEHRPACLGPADRAPAPPRANAHRLTSRGKPRYATAGPCCLPSVLCWSPPCCREGLLWGRGWALGTGSLGKPPPVSTPQLTLVLGWVFQFHLILTCSPGVMGTGFGSWEWGWRGLWGDAGTALAEGDGTEGIWGAGANVETQADAPPPSPRLSPSVMKAWRGAPGSPAHHCTTQPWPPGPTVVLGGPALGAGPPSPPTSVPASSVQGAWVHVLGV